jgi:hypothetical protein
MPTISVRVDEDTKERMDGIEAVNWSAVLRGRIEDVLTEHEASATDHDLARAVLLTERIYKSVSPEDINANEWDSAEFIRRDRERTFSQRRGAEVDESHTEQSGS